MALKIRELCQLCEQHVNELCENETDIKVLESTVEALNQGQRMLGALRGKVIKELEG
jgi:hypothetical protein